MVVHFTALVRRGLGLYKILGHANRETAGTNAESAKTMAPLPWIFCLLASLSVWPVGTHAQVAYFQTRAEAINYCTSKWVLPAYPAIKSLGAGNGMACVDSSYYSFPAIGGGSFELLNADGSPRVPPLYRGLDRNLPILVYTVDDRKNVGDGGGCNGGEGHAGAISGPTCQQAHGSPVDGNPSVGDPINTATGNSYRQDDDYSGSEWLMFRRFYNSDPSVASTTMGAHWSHSFNRSLSISSSLSRITVNRPDGKQEVFVQSNGVWTPTGDVPDTLVETDDVQGTPIAYTLFVAALRHFEEYDSNGLLHSVTDQNGTGATLVYSTTLTPSQIAPKPGLLITVMDPRGRQLNFNYDASARVNQITLPDGGTLAYAYDVVGNLASVQYPDTHSLQYAYNESSLTGGASLPDALTGVIDETGGRFESTSYDSTGRGTSSSFAGGGIGVTSVVYNSDGTSTVTYPLGNTMTMGYTMANGLVRASSISQPCGPICGQPWKTRTYDANSNPLSYVDFNGNITATTYSNAALLTQQIDAKGQATQRTTNFTWDSTLRVPLTRTVLDNNGNTVAYDSWVYNTFGQATARCSADPSVTGATGYTCGSSASAPAGVRQWRYTYCNAVDSTQCPLVGLLLSVDGPRTDISDITSYSYYLATDESGCSTAGGACHRAGDLYQVANALGQIATVVAYDKNGRVARQSDANGVITDLIYSPRGWLLTRTARANADGSASSGDAVTTIGYTPYGAVASITDADGVTVSYTYDAAHRLTDITDALGDRIHYTLDAAGNKTQEQTFDPSGTVRRTLSRTYNTLGQLTKVTDGLSNAVFNAGYSDSYDASGNLVHTADALGVQRKQGYDGLNRLVSTIDNYNGTDTATQNTQSVFAYDAKDQLQGVSDPGGLNTTYSYDGLGNTTGVQSPDTGNTAYVYDAAGNVTQRTDARGGVSNSNYDALNRRTATTYADGTLNVAYGYDEPNSVTGCAASYPVGRLTRIIETAVTTVYCYDAHGNVTHKSQTQGTVTDVTAYSYTLADRLASTLTPAGTSIQYTRDAAGRISGVTTLPQGTSGAGAGNIVTAITYLPFGPIASYTLGNGQTITRSYDANYALTDVVSPAINLHFARDAMGDITALGNAPGANPAVETYRYDPLYRLTGLYDASNNPEETYTYSKTGDRLSKTGNGLATGAYTYQTGTHHLTAIGNAARTYDANGNTTGSVIGGNTFGYGYNGRNRMTVVQSNGSTVGTYTYNALGQRTAKVVTFPAAGSQRFAYDEGGQLIGEYGSNSRDYIWMDDLPVAVVDTSAGASTVSYVHADGLSTPRAVTSSGGSTIWQLPYQANPFDEQQPSSANGFVYNPRFPGQYYDQESGLSDWGFRTYEPATGGSPQSDPMGMFGGQWSTYAYASNDPLRFTDPLGLEVDVCRDPAFNGNLGPIDHYWLRTDTQEAGMGTAAAGANAGNQYDSPISKVQTVDHTGRGNGPKAECRKANGADEAIVNRLIKPGRPLGYFVPPVNYCHSFVQDVLHQAHGEDPFDPQGHPMPIPSPYLSDPLK